MALPIGSLIPPSPLNIASVPIYYHPPTLHPKYHTYFVFSSAPQLHELGSVDHAFTDDRIDIVAEPECRAFTYLLLSDVRFAYASTARVIVVKFVSSVSATADVLALASAEFDLSDIEVGKTVTVKWPGKPAFIRHRTAEEISAEAAVSMSHLRDQEADDERTLKSQWFIVLGFAPILVAFPSVEPVTIMVGSVHAMEVPACNVLTGNPKTFNISPTRFTAPMELQNTRQGPDDH